MLWMALKMLVGDRGKYLGIVAGMTFASLLISQQASIFCGLMLLTSNRIRDIEDAEIWVMDGNVQFIDDIKPMSDNDLFRVRGVSGVKWAVRLYKGLARARLDNGDFEQVNLIGLDDANLVGAPQEMVVGQLTDLWQPDAVIIDERGFKKLWPGEKLDTGRILEMNDRRARIVGICRVRQTFQTFPVVFARYSQAIAYNPPQRKMLSFVLADPSEGRSANDVCQAIEAQTGLQARTSTEFMWQTIYYYLQETGIPVNFGITVILGFLVGSAIAAQTFYLFAVENLRHFAMLKANGATNLMIVGMILLQAITVGVISYGLGVGLAALFGLWTGTTQRLAFYMPWEVLALTGAAVLLMAIVSSLLAIRRVITLEPALVFQD